MNLDRQQRLSVRVESRYGHFSADGTEYCITDPKTPRPWVNIIANPRMGLAISQTGSGFTWIDDSQLAVITRWLQDLTQDSSGKFVYVRDADSGEIWSLSPAPVWAAYDQYVCCHGLGYTRFTTEFAGIRAEWTLLCDAHETAELWQVEFHNLSTGPRRLEVCAYLKWCSGVAPSPRREFHKLFIETEFDAQRGAVFARNHMWEVPSERNGHWNSGFPYVSALAGTEPIHSAQGDNTAFLGRYGNLRSPEALRQDRWQPRFGRHEDAIAALRCVVELRGGERRRLGYALAVTESHESTEQLLDRMLNVGAMDRALDEVRSSWRARLAAHRVEMPEPSLDFLTNDWLRYQAISGRMWGRCGYYQQSGAYGFRDQLQDSQVWLTIDPQRCREQINLHAAHQFADGSVYHWWHPLAEQGYITGMTDDLLWLAFVTANYIRETGNLDILQDVTPFVDQDQPRPLSEHVRLAFERVFQRTSPRGLPHIGAGDWNDGLSAVGLQEYGESIWLGHFLVGLLADWTEVYRRIGENKLAADFENRRTALVVALNEHGWDGEWYIRATLDDGSKLGSAENRVAKIFLNPQTWAVLNDVAPADRAAQCMAAVREHLISEAGALLLAPAFDQPDPKIGYITRYAPGLRENGGVYTHAATWAIAAACKMRDHELVGQLLTAINPALKDPEKYWAEPYVTPGNVDGPASPYHGRGGWTWYTGSAAWLHRVVNEWVLGVRPVWDGLHIEPCLPAGWKRASMTRPWRGCTYRFQIERSDDLPEGVNAEVTLGGTRLATNLIPLPTKPGEQHDVRVRCR
jgi:cellobiose phosphorylase